MHSWQCPGDIGFTRSLVGPSATQVARELKDLFSELSSANIPVGELAVSPLHSSC